MKTFKSFCLAALAMLALAVPASAQVLTIHGAPQGKTTYASSAEWPTDSGQCHWPDSGFTPDVPASETMNLNLGLAHTHIDLTFPRYAEVPGPIENVPFTLKLFHTTGRISGIYPDRIRDVTWDETGTSQMPDMRGDPHGVKQWSGHFTIDLTVDNHWHPVQLHGWEEVGFSTVTQFDAGDFNVSKLYEPVWSILDPSAPLPAWEAFISRVACEPQSLVREMNHFGTTIVEFQNEYLPIAPLKSTWTGGFQTAGYGAANDPNLPDVVVQERVDLDLHNGVQGQLAFHTSGRQNQVGATSLDPLTLGVGSHKVAFIRDQKDGQQEVLALFVQTVSVPPAGQPPPPTLCADPTASNYGQPIPCVYPPPPPPPPPTFTVFTFTCDAAGKCQLVIK